ncbi:PREDICTED: homeobox protein cut-like 1 [Hipposideros armiger]|uniref:Homeobox protein cut-like 1 n=1 Tax=Hipposideros armiger TaxID=186990 RepID=A0A8B7PZQ9_HIPAR|nr:PREDICTED: homeobox protein cut-like 1 [Hipposideros armiger]
MEEGEQASLEDLPLESAAAVSAGGGAGRSLPEAPSPPSEEDVLEGAPEVLIEDGVDDRVERAVAVADPEEELEERVGHLAGLAADAVQAVAEEEGEPAEHEHAHHHGQHEGLGAPGRGPPLLPAPVRSLRLQLYFPGQGAGAASAARPPPAPPSAAPGAGASRGRCPAVRASPRPPELRRRRRRRCLLRRRRALGASAAAGARLPTWVELRSGAGRGVGGRGGLARRPAPPAREVRAQSRSPRPPRRTCPRSAREGSGLWRGARALREGALSRAGCGLRDGAACWLAGAVQGRLGSRTSQILSCALRGAPFPAALCLDPAKGKCSARISWMEHRTQSPTQP